MSNESINPPVAPSITPLRSVVDESDSSGHQVENGGTSLPLGSSEEGER